MDVIIVPVGGGSGACGACIVAKSAWTRRKQVIGVQAASAPAAYLSWKEGRIVESKMETVAEGLATRLGFELTQGILRDMLDDFVLVSEEELAQGRGAPSGEHAQPHRARRRRLSGGRHQAQGPPSGQGGRAGHERRQHHPGPAKGGLWDRPERPTPLRRPAVPGALGRPATPQGRISAARWESGGLGPSALPPLPPSPASTERTRALTSRPGSSRIRSLFGNPARNANGRQD